MRFPAYIAAIAALMVLLSAGCRKDPALDGGVSLPREIKNAPYALYYLNDNTSGSRAEIVQAGLSAKGGITGRTNLLSGLNSLNYGELRNLDVTADGAGVLFSALRDNRHGVYQMTPKSGAMTELFEDLAFDPEFSGNPGMRAMLITESLNDLLLEVGPDDAEPVRRHMLSNTSATLGSLSCGGGNTAFVALVPGEGDYSDPRGKPSLMYLGAGMENPLMPEDGPGEVRDFSISADGSTLAWIMVSDEGMFLSWAAAKPDGLGEEQSLQLNLRAFVSDLYLSPDGSSAWMIHHQAEPLSPLEPMEGELLRIPLQPDTEPERLYAFENGHRMLFGDISVTPDGGLFSMALVPRDEAFVEDLYGPQPWDILIFDGNTGEITHVERATLSGGRRPGAMLREGGQG